MLLRRHSFFKFNLSLILFIIELLNKCLFQRFLWVSLIRLLREIIFATDIHLNIFLNLWFWNIIFFIRIDLRIYLFYLNSGFATFKHVTHRNISVFWRRLHICLSLIGFSISYHFLVNVLIFQGDEFSCFFLLLAPFLIMFL